MGLAHSKDVLHSQEEENPSTDGDVPLKASSALASSGNAFPTERSQNEVVTMKERQEEIERDGRRSHEELGVHKDHRTERERDHALVLDLMEYFCFAIKPGSTFSGAMTFVFDQEVDEETGAIDPKPALEVTVTVEKGDASDERPRVVVTSGGPPEGSGEAKGHVHVPYKQFLLIYSGKASAKEIMNMAMQRKMKVSGFGAFMQFGFSFEYSASAWDSYYAAKDAQGEDAMDATDAGGGGADRVLFSSDPFRAWEQRQWARQRAQAEEEEARLVDAAASAVAYGEDDDSSSSSSDSGSSGGRDDDDGGSGGIRDKIFLSGQRIASWLRGSPPGGQHAEGHGAPVHETGAVAAAAGAGGAGEGNIVTARAIFSGDHQARGLHQEKPGMLDASLGGSAVTYTGVPLGRAGSYDGSPILRQARDDLAGCLRWWLRYCRGHSGSRRRSSSGDLRRTLQEAHPLLFRDGAVRQLPYRSPGRWRDALGRPPALAADDNDDEAWQARRRRRRSRVAARLLSKQGETAEDHGMGVFAPAAAAAAAAAVTTTATWAGIETAARSSSGTGGGRRGGGAASRAGRGHVRDKLVRYFAGARVAATIVLTTILAASAGGARAEKTRLREKAHARSPPKQ